jgi:hypothetical protein
MGRHTGALCAGAGKGNEGQANPRIPGAGFLQAAGRLTAKVDRKPGKAPKPGGIVPPLDAHYLAHELITQKGRAARLALVPLSDRYRDALRWRMAKLLPIVAAPAYAELWKSTDQARRAVLLAAIFQSGDFHYSASQRELRQALARWLHGRLITTEARQRELEGFIKGDLM